MFHRTSDLSSSAKQKMVHNVECMSNASSDSGQITRVAPAPFDKSEADLVLRSSDDVDFYVFKWILVDVSAVFARKLRTLPEPELPATERSPAEGYNGGLRSNTRLIINLTESSATLEPLLRICYPGSYSSFSPITFPSFDAAKPLLLAAHKYEMAALSKAFEQAVLPLVGECPISIYAFAAQHDLAELMRAAARASLNLVFPWPYASELDAISTAAYHQLIVYYFRCKTALAGLSVSANSFTEDQSTWESCKTCVSGWSSSSVRPGLAKWFSDLMAQIRTKLEKRPSPDALQEPGFADDVLKKTTACGSCRKVAHRPMREFMAFLKGDMDRTLRSVRRSSRLCFSADVV